MDLDGAVEVMTERPTPVSHEEFEQAIAVLDRIDLPQATLQQLKEALRPIFQGHVRQAPVLAPGLALFRARRMSKKPAARHEVFAPPNELVADWGRVNQPGYASFYASAHPRVALAEVGAQPGDLVAISRWHTTRQILLNQIGFETVGFGRLDPTQPLPKAPSAVAPSAHDAQVARYLSHKFTIEVPEGSEILHKMTVAIAQMHSQGDFIDGLLYPSVARKGSGDNVALKVASAQTALNLQHVRWVEIVERNGLDFTLKEIDYSYRADGQQLVWQRRPPPWVLVSQGEEARVISDGRYWTIRMPDGVIVYLD